MKKSHLKWTFIIAAAGLFLSSLSSCERHTCPTYSQVKTTSPVKA